MTILGLLRQYRYMTRDLMALVYSDRRGGSGTEELKNHLGRLWKYKYVDRFTRPVQPGHGTRQPVYVLRPEGARLLIPEHRLLTDWPIERFRVYNRLKPKSDYEHALAVTLFQILWDLGATDFRGVFTTKAYWPDREGDRHRRVNSFTVRLDGKRVTLNPDTTAWLVWLKSRHLQPLFLEIERTHKNLKRTVQRFRAYQQLLAQQHETVIEACRRDVDKSITPARGAVLFVGANRGHRDRLREIALETIGSVSRNNPNVPTFWFSSLEDLFERRDGHEQIIRPADLFIRPIAIQLNGRPWTIVN